jgi:hypothetical protein
MKYLVMEIQTFDTGAVSTPTYAYDTRDAAERQFHLLVAGAVVSALPTHAVTLMTSEGQLVERKVYHHAPAEEEPEPETEPETPTEEN